MPSLLGFIDSSSTQVYAAASSQFFLPRLLFMKFSRASFEDRLSFTSRGELCRRIATGKAADHFFQRTDPGRMLVHAGNLGELLAAGFQKVFTATYPDFFDRFEAIGNKCRANNQQFSHSGCGELWQFEIGVGFQPRVTAKSRLE